MLWRNSGRRWILDLQELERVEIRDSSVLVYVSLRLSVMSVSRSGDQHNISRLYIVECTSSQVDYFSCHWNFRLSLWWCTQARIGRTSRPVCVHFQGEVSPSLKLDHMIHYS